MCPPRSLALRAAQRQMSMGRSTILPSKVHQRRKGVWCAWHRKRNRQREREIRDARNKEASVNHTPTHTHTLTHTHTHTHTCTHTHTHIDSLNTHAHPTTQTDSSALGLCARVPDVSRPTAVASLARKHGLRIGLQRGGRRHQIQGESMARAMGLQGAGKNGRFITPLDSDENVATAAEKQRGSDAGGYGGRGRQRRHRSTSTKKTSRHATRGRGGGRRGGSRGGRGGRGGGGRRGGGGKGNRRMGTAKW